MMGRYKLVVEGTRIETSANDSSNTSESTSCHPANGQDSSSHDDGEILLDLSTPEDIPGSQVSSNLVNKDLEEIGMWTLM